MALNIKDPETDRLVRELASLTGQSITTVVRDAVMARLAVARARTAEDRRRRREIIDEIAERGRSLPVLDDRTPDEILGYDEHGLPS